MRSMWAGEIAFGPVRIPVRLYPATEQRDISFRQVHREDGGKITFRRVCATCGKEIPYSEVAKGYERPGGDVVVLSDEDLATLPLERAHQIEVLHFTQPGEIDPILVSRSYFLEPESAGPGAYVLFREALGRSGKVAIVRLVLRQRESLAELRVAGGVLVLRTLLRPDEVAEARFPFLAEEVEVSPQELRMATSLIDSMTRDFDPAVHRDRYPGDLDDLARRK
jgi:DNA end-binding protein Ku